MNTSEATFKSSRNEKYLWPESSSMKQQFSFPDSFVYYILKNPSTPKCYLKMAKSCKYFFEKNPILIAAQIYDNGTKICSNGLMTCHCKEHKCCRQMDITKISCKIWITDVLKFSYKIPCIIAAEIYSKIYRCDDAVLKLLCVKITLEEFKLLVSKFQKFYFIDVVVINRDGNVMMLEGMIESIPQLHTFEYEVGSSLSILTTSSLKNICELQKLADLHKFTLYNVSEIFAIDDLDNFIKKFPETKIKFDFLWNISDQYKIQLEQLISTIVESAVPNRIITFDNQNCVNYQMMKCRYSG